MRRALTIAGSDSGGGAGIQADLKTFTAFGVYGMSVITAVTAQNTLGVQAVHPLPPAFVAQQLASVLSDIGVDHVKTGMLVSKEIVEIVCQVLDEFKIQKIVVDPVMKSGSGQLLLAEDAIESVKKLLLPLASIVTPNISEASVLSGQPITNLNDMKEAAKKIKDLGPEAVLITGGHLPGNQIYDIFYDGAKIDVRDTDRIPTKNTHGSGCTLSAAITAGLAKKQMMKEAVAVAQRYTTNAIRSSFNLGQGAGPLNHFVKII
jgi:hydroxymethylpyrimidine/phosphomethylpyrimidine kinase